MSDFQVLVQAILSVSKVIKGIFQVNGVFQFGKTWILEELLKMIFSCMPEKSI